MTKPTDRNAPGPAAIAPDGKDWHRDNDAYLSASVTHMRLKLEAFVAWQDKGGEGPKSPPRRRVLFGGRSGPPPAPPPAAATPQDVKRAAEARAKARADMEGDPALILLGERFGLTEFEREVLLLCAAVEFDTRIAGLCAAAQADAGRDHPTFALALALFDDPAWDVMLPMRPLRFWRLLEISQPGNRPLTTSALRADEKVTNFLKGLVYLDDRLSPLLVPFDEEAGARLPPSQEEAVALAVAQMRQQGRDRPASVQLVGPDSPSRQMVAQRALRELGMSPFRMPAALLPHSPEELERLGRLWHRESLLMPIALYLDTDAGAGGGQTGEPPVAQFLSRSGGVFVIGAREGHGNLGAAVEVSRPTAQEQARLWAEALPDDGAGPAAERLSSQFDLGAPAIRRIARSAETGPDALWQACIAEGTPAMDRLAERIRPVARWEDLVLPEPELHLLHRIAGQVARRARVYDDWGFRERMNRGLGISALFSGDSGTGKTMAAEVIANALDLRLYRIDLSAVVSKYIGETEKNLSRLFDAAEGGGAILFFDEADALFGKRSEVRDSHDRYANIETSYLLQRVESFGGLAILSTNMRGALDAAFLRRLRFVIGFPYPGPGQRRAIWANAWPKDVPLGDLDYDRLARLNLSGGNIATVAVNAAFMAAEADKPVSMPMILAAARAEYEKLERPMNAADFTWRDTAKIREVTA